MKLSSRNAVILVIMVLGLTVGSVFNFAGPVLYVLKSLEIPKIINVATEKFDYKDFANSLVVQVPELIPPDLSKTQGEFVYNNVNKYSLQIGEKVSKEKKYSTEEKAYITQVVAEWIFHKSVDLCHSEIPEQYRDMILQKITDDIFDVFVKIHPKKYEQSKELEIIENTVIASYSNSIETLYKENKIDKKNSDKAKSLSNIDDMVEQMVNKEK